MPAPAEFNPLIASVWADAIVACWRTAHAEGRLDPSQPLDVLDLVPGSGESGLQMILALRRRTAALPEFSGLIRYLPVASRRDLLNTFRTQPEFQPYLQEGTLVPVLWDPERGDPCLIHTGKRAAWAPVNLAAVLAHDSWAYEEQRLCAVHYGKLLEADIARLSQCTSPEQEATLWHPMEMSRLDDVLGAVIKRYLSKFNSVPVPLPTGAVAQLQRISSLAGNGYILLAVAHGLTSERQIRLNHFSEVLAHYRMHGAMPVNFHVLSQYCSEVSVLARQADIRPGLGAQAMLGNFHDMSRYLAAVGNAMDAIATCDAPSLAEAVRATAATRLGPKLDTLLALLKRSEYDPMVFHAGAAAIIDALRSQPRLERQPWAEALSRVWSCHLPSEQSVPLHRSLAPAAMRVSAWHLARQVLIRGMQAHGETALDLAHLAWCEMRTGNAARALPLIRRAASFDDDDPTVREVLQTIDQKVLSWKGGWLVSLPSATIRISLEPLDIGHAEALWYQYRDPQIAIMTGLPSLPTVEATRTWIREHLNDPSRRPYAIMHRDYGLVGYVCLSVTGHEAYFCFWIGADFQGTGLSVEGARLIMQLGRSQGIAHVFTSAYQDNSRSLGALQRSGFIVLPVRALPPENDRIFLFLNLTDHPVADPSANLAAYYEREKLPLYFAGQESRRKADVEMASLTAEHAAKDAAASDDLQQIL